MILGSRQCLLSLTVLILSLSGVSPAWAKKNLDISNLSPEVQTELLKRFPYLEKERLTLEQVDEVIRFLQLRPQLDDIQVFDDGNGSPYRIHYSLTRRIGKISLQGIRHVSESEARGVFNVKTGDVFDQQSLIDDGEKLRQLYKEKGFFNAVLDIEMPPGKDDQVDIVLKVSENKRTMVQSIRFLSPNDVLNKQLNSKLDSETDEPLTDSLLGDIQKKARKYLTKNHYIRTDINGPSIEYSKDESEASLTYRLEKVDRYFIDYAGVRFLNQGAINSALDLDNFYSSSPNIGAELSTRIKNFYLSKGYARVEVTSEEIDNRTPFQKRILFNIDEGPRVKIQKIVINGRYSRNQEYYVKLIKELSSRLVAKGHYNKEDLDTGVKNLVLQLQNDGYLQSKVISTRSQYNKERDQVTFFVNLDEGPLTQIQKIDFTGNVVFTAEQLLEVIRLKPQGPLKLNQIDAAINYLKNFYHEKGYIEMYLQNQPEDLVAYDETNTLASLHFKIFEGPQVHVSSIVLEGNTFTRDSIILKELEFEPGELVTPSKIEESIARLQKTGYFGSVEVRTLEEKTNVANRTILVKVTERDPGLFTIGAGATNERRLTLRGYTGVAYRNLWGTGRGISLRLEGNYNIADLQYLESRIILGYLEPYLFGSRIRGRINVTRSNTVTDYDLHQATEIKSTTYSLEKDFTSHILGIWDVWSLATVRDFGIDDTFPSNLAITQDIATMGPTVDLDFRDSPFNPTKGTFTRLNAEYSDPAIGSTRTIKYLRATASFTKYWTVDRWFGEPVVWANQLRGGYLKNLSNEPDGGVPWDKKGFILGGQSTIRGYEAGTSEVFPNNSDLGIPDNQKYYLTTASQMFLIKSEVRFPIAGAIGGAVFYDGGSVTIDGLKFEDNYRDSAGVGFRYGTPVGPLSLEWAWKLDAKPGEEPWRFHLSIGTF
ncbi:Outer membrane protein assembly factor BamA precursor [compost metagenome]